MFGDSIIEAVKRECESVVEHSRFSLSARGIFYFNQAPRVYVVKPIYSLQGIFLNARRMTTCAINRVIDYEYTDHGHLYASRSPIHIVGKCSKLLEICKPEPIAALMLQALESMIIDGEEVCSQCRPVCYKVDDQFTAVNAGFLDNFQFAD